jgi:hypothetical protein
LWYTTEIKGFKNPEGRDPRNQKTKQESGTKGTGSPMDLKNHFYNQVIREPTGLGETRQPCEQEAKKPFRGPYYEEPND